jgi:hypothetical protein
MYRPHRKTFAQLPLFDPLAGAIVVHPPGNGDGYWAGGPSALYDDRKDLFYLSYRLRTPLGDRGWSGRGGQTVVAQSRDGLTFETIWSAKKEAFEALSIEKSCLMLTPDDRFRLYVSYSSRHDFRWRIDMLEAQHPSDFDINRRVTVLSPETTGTEGVKDPVIYIAGGLWHLYANMAPQPVGGDWAKIDRMHRESNAFVSGEVACPTGLAVSADGVQFQWIGEVIPCGESWDRYLARISALVYTPPFFTAIYDGRPNSGANYSDSPGLAITSDLRTFTKVDYGRPLLRSPYGHGTLRYVEVLRVGDTLHYFYEMERQDLAHELRKVAISLA